MVGYWKQHWYIIGQIFLKQQLKPYPNSTSPPPSFKKQFIWGGGGGGERGVKSIIIFLSSIHSQDEILRKRPRKQIWVHFLVKVATLAYFHISSMLNSKMWVAKFSFDQKVLHFHF